MVCTHLLHFLNHHLPRLTMLNFFVVPGALPSRLVANEATIRCTSELGADALAVEDRAVAGFVIEVAIDS